MNRRTRIEFIPAKNAWPIIEDWAAQNGFKTKQSKGAARLYQKGNGILFAPMMFSIKQDKERMVCEAWIRMNLLVRAMALFTLPNEMGIESGGFKAVLPRNVARGAVNKLLMALGQTQIP